MTKMSKFVSLYPQVEVLALYDILAFISRKVHQSQDQLLATAINNPKAAIFLVTSAANLAKKG